MLLTDLGAIQVVRLDIGRFVPLRFLGKGNGCPHKPVPWDSTLLSTLSSILNHITTNLYNLYSPTCWWNHCNSSLVRSHSWVPRRHAAWCGRMEQTRCGWPHGTWRQNCPGSCALRAGDESTCWFPSAIQAPETQEQNNFSWMHIPNFSVRVFDFLNQDRALHGPHI